ncbi:MAG: ribosomal RNA small subunit methyltransferase A [Candidatus Micrarchaeota archaeon]|nr:ribosomal RNA small subunit methyltransferase A [Candidatus Micrarchaeota archaeon]
MKIREKLRKHSIKPKEEEGQYFLADKYLLIYETKRADINGKDTVLEIGPGIGNLTEELAKRAKKVIGIEKDTRFQKILDGLQKKYKNIEIIYSDAVRVKYPYFNKIVSNLPFRVSLPLIFKFLEYDFDVAVLLCQERLARRVCAKPGQKGYSRLSVQISRLADVKFLRRVPRSAFYPQPKVSCALIKIKKTAPKFNIPSEDFFKEVLRYLFVFRDTSLKHSIRTLMKYGLSESENKKITSAVGSRILRKKVSLLKPKEFGFVSRVLWEVSGEEVVKHFYRYYRSKRLYRNRNL